MAELASDLIERLRARAHDPKRRTDLAALSADTVSVDSLLGQLGAANPQFAPMRGLMGQFADALKGVGVVAAGARATEREPEPLPAAATGEAVKSAEGALGRRLPPALLQLYCDIADGGFGPGGGLFSLERMAHEYRDLTSAPAGPQNQPWPPNLLPLVDTEPGYDCLDLDSGEMIGWDPEEIDSASDAAWQRSFKPVAASLGDWLEAWLARPGPAERMAEQQATWQAQGRSMAAQGMVNFYAKKSPEERAAIGLPEVGWEAELLRRNGLL